MDKSHKLTLWTLTLNKEEVKKERENIGGGQECGSRGGEIVFIKEVDSQLYKILMEVLIISFCLNFKGP